MKLILESLSNDDSHLEDKRLVKKEFLFYRRIAQSTRFSQCAYYSRNLLKQRQRSIPNENTKN